MKVFIAIVPQDYQSAAVELCLSQEEADQFIQHWAINGDTTYCCIQEEELDVNDMFHRGRLSGLNEALSVCRAYEQTKNEYIDRVNAIIKDLNTPTPQEAESKV